MSRAGRWLAGRGPWPARRPVSVSVDVSDHCNLRCSTCTAWQPEPGAARLLPATFRRVLANLDGLQGLGLDLLGAEPTLNPSLVELVATAAQAGFAPRLFSNGSLIDGELARALVQAGLRHVTISLDGALASTHDRLRGVEGSQASALAAIERLAQEGRERGLRISTCTVVTRENFRELAEIARLAHARGAGRCAFHWVSQVPVEACHAPGESAQYGAGSQNLLLDPEQLGELRQEVARTLRTERSASLALLKVLGSETFLEGRFPVASCRFAATSLNLSSRGVAYPCSHYKGQAWGSVAEQHWRQVWSGNERREFLAGVRQSLLPACAYCCHHMHNLTLPQLACLALGIPLWETGDMIPESPEG